MQSTCQVPPCSSIQVCLAGGNIATFPMWLATTYRHSTTGGRAIALLLGSEPNSRELIASFLVSKFGAMVAIENEEPPAMPSIQVKDSQPSAFPRPFLIDRRAKVRFPLELRVSYRTLGRGSICAGEGWVVNISRGGILVSSPQDVGVGAGMELNIEWPSLLYGRVPLRFVVAGKVVRSDASSFAMILARHQFRTAKKKVTSIDVSGDQGRRSILGA